MKLFRMAAMIVGISMNPPAYGWDTAQDLPRLSIADASIVEGDAPTMNFKITLSSPSLSPITVAVGPSNKTAHRHLDFDYNYYGGQDYLTFQPGETVKVAEVVIHDEDVYETDETFYMHVAPPYGTVAKNFTIERGEAQGIIRNDEEPPVVGMYYGANFSFTELDGSSNIPYWVRLSRPTQLPVSVEYVISGGSAIQGKDFIPDANTGTLTFLPMDPSREAGNHNAAINIVIIGDKKVEPLRESFYIDFKNPVNATLDEDRVTYTIIDNDGSNKVR